MKQFQLTTHNSQFTTLSSVFVISLVMLALFSCKKDLSVKNPVPLNAVAANPLKDSNFVSLSVAAKAAKQVNNSHLVSGVVAKKTIQSTNSLSGKQILDSLAVPNNVNPSYYIFNYVGGGYIIIPADKRVEPILAYSNDGYFAYTSDLPYGVANWLSVNDKNMQLLRKNTGLKVPPGVAKLWVELNVTVSDTGHKKVINVTQPPPPPPSSCQPTNSVQTIGPLLQTIWGQGQPYNYLCPVGAYDAGHAPTGCVATAMAQVMYYWKAPARYNWSIMPLSYNNYGLTYPGNRDVSQLMLDAGTSVQMVYTAAESSPSNTFLHPLITCTGAFKNSFGYSSSSEGSYDYTKVVANLNAGEPVLLSGDTNTDGHEWVCDGYEQTYYTWCPTSDSPGGGEDYLLLHMNWGWDNVNNCNGWFNFNQWIVSDGVNTFNWQYYQSMTYNIHP
jgi:hypothetical protein